LSIGLLYRLQRSTIDRNRVGWYISLLLFFSITLGVGGLTSKFFLSA
jgi:hypothetical protein